MTRAQKRETYHHGSLRETLINAADAIIRERGLEGFSLREATRRAGVSPGAPKHHFGSTAGLLTEVAIKAYDEQATYMDAVALTGEVARDLRAHVSAFVRFAFDHPGRFRLMFRTRTLQKDERLDAAAARSLERTARLMAAYSGVELTDDTTTVVSPQVTASIATAYGLALMALEELPQPDGFPLEQAMLLGTTITSIVEAQWPDR
ncbi:TetR/AcrR family transcriptional regulator [Sphingomonas sp. PL-96]|uniref:TetR/AcrR family transcriptional regulator n=1 Tax=Sphingomonas sp. PL-96 TaxID=2887201 RepID=UPI001E5CD577|nr:TetR/AcrR family transcriptional regulator [Sphingomonas sp. PL-96]MCC2978238.1 TetR/AcrR family transcriptional regulator [Sphingomonas sp. PL-96]